MAPIGVALIGGGIFIKEEHLPAVLATPLLSLKAIYSRTLKSAQDTATLLPDRNPNVDLYSTDAGPGKTYADLLTRPDISAVIIALPIMNQPLFIEQALLAHKHVLSEKPIAPDVAGAKKLLAFAAKLKAEQEVAHQADASVVVATWSVAENFRFTPSYIYAAEKARELGAVQTFTMRIFFLVQPGTKWIETEWRKTPDHQGGFLLDAGVHFTAATRLLLGDDAKAKSLVAYSGLVQPYLPPVDTLHAIMKTESGVVGSFLFSVGTHLEGGEYALACEGGTVTASSSKVEVQRVVDGEKQEMETKEFDWCSGVKEEVVAWAEVLGRGGVDAAQSPEQAMADLELLEKMLKSGEENGSAQALEFQS